LPWFSSKLLKKYEIDLVSENFCKIHEGEFLER
jgi:hypothetical protein